MKKQLLCMETIDDGNLKYTGIDTSYTLNDLPANKEFYWQVKAMNSRGAETVGSIWSFRTTNFSNDKTFNYPNPFNPLREKTNVVFNMEDQGNVEIQIYSEFGDLCYSGEFFGLNRGNNEIMYDGRDNNGKVLYNGTYICRLIRKYNGHTNRSDCRILIIK
jgi:flagellar hook assembly protein FlgD